MYDLEIVIRRSANPLRVPKVQSESRVEEIIESFLEAWGIPIPGSVGNAGQSTFAEQLAATGDFSHEEADYRIIVRRSG